MIEEQQQLNKMTRKISSSYQNIISKLIEDCKKEPNKDKRIEILNRINSNLLKPDQLKLTLLSSHLTNDNIDKLLHMLKGKLLLV
jgi:ABC-type xylose transport system substrate-binding protein